MEELNNIINSIKQHTKEEIEGYFPNKSIGRGEITLAGMKSPKVIWIINRPETSAISFQSNITGAANTIVQRHSEVYREDSAVLVIPKNREYARILLQNHEGIHSCLFLNGKTQHFIINNSSTYLINYNYVVNIAIGIAGKSDLYKFKSIGEAISYVSQTAIDIREKQKEVEEAKKVAEELRKKQLEKSENEAKRIEEEARIKEEEAKKLQLEIEKLQLTREQTIEAVSKASEFIRKQVSLKHNPILDIHQDSAKFSNLYNGVAEIINGGPGTGKTTTMIQRLKLLIDGEDLRDYKQNHKTDCSFTEEQIKLIESLENNWIFFSPNELLKKYLQDNMNYEGLTKTNQCTVVWKTFLNDVTRDEYHLAGNDCPFVFTSEKTADKNLYTGDHITIINNFSKFVINQIKERFLKISAINCNSFKWKIIGEIITSECAKVKNVSTFPELIKFLFNLANVEKSLNNNIVSVNKIISDYNKSVGNLTDKSVALLKKDDSSYEETIKLINLHNQAKKNSNEEDADDEDSIDEDVNHGNIDIQLYHQISPIIRKLALQKKDTTAKLTGFQKQIYDIISSTIIDAEINEIADSAFFVKHIAPALRGIQQYVLNPIPQYYKSYRKNLTDSDKQQWDNDILREIVETRQNKCLLNQEQSLLIGFINEIVRTICKVNKNFFNTSTHKYIEAYKALCRPVIGVDEATDYSIIDYWGIKSFGHYEICSYTICGDIMQLMKADGIRNWNVLKNSLLFRKIDIHNLSMSYRQSEELLNLANKIYLQERGEISPYKCYLQGNNTPHPLWLVSDSTYKKAHWIADRVIEIVKVYNSVPTIAIFTINQNKAAELKDELDECENLIEAGIQIKVCTDSNLEGEKTLRIFPINQVKGMEFEAAIFYDIDDIESTSLINRYLYVGLSRASMYLAVTSTGQSKQITDLLKNYFIENGTWR